MTKIFSLLARRSVQDVAGCQSSVILKELESYIYSFSLDGPARRYAETHMSRLLKTLQIIPPGAETDAILEMGAYMQITPALRTRLGYGLVRGAYLGPASTVDEKYVVSDRGESFSCFIDLFDAEADPFPYPDSLEWAPKVRQTVKARFSSNGESHEFVSTEILEGV